MFKQILSAVGPFALAARGLAHITPTPSTRLGPTSFAPPGAFPTSVYKSYFNDPTATSAQPQPVISDPVLHSVYPFALTNPNDIPQNDTKDPHPLPPVVSSSQLAQAALTQIQSLITNPIFSNDSCASCQAILEVVKFVALAAPEETPNLLVQLCEELDLSSDCEDDFGLLTLGSPLSQVIASADVGGYDGQAICWNVLNGQCPMPPTSPLNLTGWFAKPKPNPVPPPRKASGKLLKVLHLTDMHIDPRYATGAESNCSSYLCCRENTFNTDSPHKPTVPAPRYGAYFCDTPYSLMLAAVQAIPVLTGTEKTGFDFGIYTGDLVSHDPENELSRDYVMYAETVLYDLLKRVIGTGPFYVTLGNHDTHNEAQDAPHSIGGALADQFSWNYDHVTSLWQHEGWINESTVQLARAHYAAYSVRRTDGLRIITLNTDFWYTANLFNYINLTTSDNSGMLRFLTDELQDAEDVGDRAWILGHVPSGWDGTNPLANPTNLFYQIVDRFSPHVIAGIFFGHDHEDQLQIFYANNGTVMSAETAQAVAWLAPSLTPLTNLNSGFRMYEVDSATFDIVNAYTWKADVNSFSELDNQTKAGPAYVLEYSTREAYGASIGFGPHDPLNATWWHLVTEAMEADNSLVTTFNTFQGKSSVRSPACTGDCITAKICYIRSGSTSLAMANCIPGFGSVQ